MAHEHGAWVHIDGAFGLWAAASSQLRHLTAGVERADSWTTDAHKTLNVPYDSGIAIVRHPDALYAAMGVHAAYLIQDDRPDPVATVPEFSRRARGFAVWAALRSLGRSGVARMVEGFCEHAATSLPASRRWAGYGSSTTSSTRRWSCRSARTRSPERWRVDCSPGAPHG